MHVTALQNCRRFLGTYAPFLLNKGKPKVLDVGSLDFNGSLRQLAHPDFEYIGVDFEAGNGVDIVLQDPYSLPFEDESIDMVLSSSCFEHSEMFWLLFLEIMRILKPHGLFYLNVPTNGYFHRYPVDCWRFYPDSGNALITWAKRNNMNAALLESYVSDQCNDNPAEIWNDYVAVFLKDESQIQEYPRRILEEMNEFKNGTAHGFKGFIKKNDKSEDHEKLELIRRIIDDSNFRTRIRS